jgi:hypothetical protein
VAIHVKKRKFKVIFMEQEPGLRVERRLGLQVNISRHTLASFSTVCFSGQVIEAGSKLVTAYEFPASCRRGAILMSRDDHSHLLVLFNIEMQYVGRHACKVIYTGADYEPTLMQKQLLYLARRVHEEDEKEEMLDAELSRQPIWSLVHSEYGPSNSRSSFAYLPNNRVAFAKIMVHDISDSNNGANLVLHVHIQDHSERPHEPYELPGSDVPISFLSDLMKSTYPEERRTAIQPRRFRKKKTGSSPAQKPTS